MTQQPTPFDLCRQQANSAVLEHLDMNAAEYRAFCVEEALKLNTALPMPFPEDAIRDTAPDCASWARNNLVPAALFKKQQRAMAQRRNAASNASE